MRVMSPSSEQLNNLDTDYTYNAAGDLLTVTAPDNLVTTMRRAAG